MSFLYYYMNLLCVRLEISYKIDTTFHEMLLQTNRIFIEMFLIYYSRFYITLLLSYFPLSYKVTCILNGMSPVNEKLVRSRTVTTE